MLKHKLRINFIKMGLAIVMMAVGLFSVGVAVHAAGSNNNDYTASTGVNRDSGISSTGTALSTSSPVTIVFPSSGSFALNYVDKTGYVSPDGSTNPSGVSNLTDSSGNITLNNNQLMKNGNSAYSGGYLQAHGNLSLRVTLDSSVSGTNFVNNMSSGNYGVMVKIELPKDMDASAMAKAIVWDKAYMMLQMSVPLAGSPQFPMQFDHHVYLDPDHSNVFFLKVKGIPLIHSETNGIFQTKSSTIKLARFAQDSIDYQNNVASDGSVITPSELGTSANGKTEYGSVLDVWEFLPPGFVGSVGLNGSVGYSLAMINRASGLS
ncbi:hypothetical protein [Secundilactobacillus oryzae]|nr:hypothetical protein [Secundilactobacillus oryzae]